MRILIPFLVVALAGVPKLPAAAQGVAPATPRAVAELLRDQANRDRYAYRFLTELTTRFGARPAGSDAEQQAARWGAEQLAQAGLQDVRIEPFPLVVWDPRNVRVETVAPSRQQLVAVLLGGSPPAQDVTAEVVLFKTYDELRRAPPGSLKDKIAAVLEPVHRDPDGADYVRLVANRYRAPSEAQRQGARAFVMRSLATHDARVASSGATAMDAGIPAFALSPPDAEQLERLAAIGTVRLRLNASVRTAPGQSQNVVASIPGTDADPRRWIVIGAHLDSWDQGTGAVDDGFGIAVVTAAARLIARLPDRPRHGIRVVWFGAEEVSQPAPVGDFAGARAYRARHAAELASYLGASESDWGAGPITSVALPDELAGGSLATELGEVLAPLDITIRRAAPKSGGPDVAILEQAGVRAFRLNQAADALFDVHHTANDVLDRIDPAALNQNVAAWAAVLWMLANRDD